MVRQRDPRLMRRAPARVRGGGQNAAGRADEPSKTAFLSLISHELKTPLNTILGQAELLLMDALPDHARQAVAAIRDAGQGLNALIADLLDISRQEHAPSGLEAADLDVRALVDGVKRILALEARARGLDFEVAVDPAIPSRLAGDTARMRQVLLRLADNALKFTERGGVSVSASFVESTGELRFAVSDTGIGVDPADQARIFDLFEQSESLLTRSHSGLGLGLALAARLVRAMGGRIGLESRPAVGATFWFTAPVSMPADGTIPDPGPLEDGRIDPGLIARLRGLSVLAADDNPLHRAALARIFDACGIDADIVADGLEAAEAAGRRAYAIVLLDAHMPVAGGIQAARMIRTLGQRQIAPYLMIACTEGDPAEPDAADVADAILRKPYGGRALAAALAAALDGARPVSGELDTVGLADLELSVGRGVLVDILRSYMSAAEAMTARIEAALPGDYAPALEQAARDLASAAGGLGLAALTAAAQELSQAARSGGVTQAVSAQAERLIALSSATRDQLTALYPDLTSAA